MIGGYKVAALCISRIHDDTTHRIISELNEALTGIGYRLFVYHTCSDLFWKTPGDAGEATVFDLIDMRVTDVLIIADEIIKDKSVIRKLIDRALIFEVPVITISGEYENTVSIDFDYAKGFEEVVKHVVADHGIRDLHMIAGLKDNTFSEERIDVFAKVLAENGIPFDRETMVSYGDFWSEPASKAVTKLIEEKRLPKALICANDSMALAICATLMKAGIRVPDDLLVTGFDGIPDIAFSNPRITSSFCSYADISELIARLLSRDREQLLRTARYRITPRVLISESCGCTEHTPMNAAEHISYITGRFNRYKEDERTLNEIAARILASDDPETACNELNSSIIYNMRCMLRKEVIDETADPLNAGIDLGRAETLCVFYDSDGERPFKPYDFPAREIIPGLEVALADGHPIIMTALHFLDVPLGYVTFTYEDYNILNYEKIPQVMNALNNSIGGLRNLRYQQYMNRKIEKLSLYDQLTEMFTRNGATSAYNTLVRMLKEHDRPITVIMADLDGLKIINDKYGHNEGDFAIRTVASTLRATAPDNAVCIRMGGDELLAFFSGSTPLADIRDEISARLKAANKVSGKPYTVSTSIGIYRTKDGDIPSFEELVHAADEEMYKDKAKKRHRRRTDKVSDAKRDKT
jgi:diguanylate cyclase (GGDEF)-like protein